MIIHRAETGATYTHPTPLRSALKAHDLHAFLAELLGIQQGDVLALLGNGEVLRVREDYALAGLGEGEGEGEGGEGEEVWVYDLGIMRGEGMGGLELGLQGLEEPLIRETAPAYTRPSTYLPPAQSHLSSLSSLLPSFRAQQSSLLLAHSTLHTHLRNLTSALTAFTPLASRALAAQAHLLAAHPLSMRLNARVRITPEVRRMGQAKWHKGRESLGDFVNPQRMQVVEQQCRGVFQELAGRWREVRRREKELEEGAERARRAAEELVPQEAERAYERATEALRRVQTLVEEHSDEEPETEREWEERDRVMSELRALDESIRSELRLMVSFKNGSTSTTISTLRLISTLQSSISQLPPLLKSLEQALRINTLSSSSSFSSPSPGGAGFVHLQRVHRALFAYGALIVEIVRRREFKRFFHLRCKALGELMHKLTSREHRRRLQFRTDTAGVLPFELRGLDAPEDPVPSLEITVLGAGEGEWQLGRGDVEGVLALVRELEGLPWPEASAGGSVYSYLDDDGGERVHPAAEARQALEKLLTRMEGLEEGFDRLAERSLLCSTWGGPRQRTISEVSGYREALDELRELKRAKGEAAGARDKERDVLADEVAALQAELTLAQAQGDELRARAERAEGEVRSARSLAESDRSVRQTLERRHTELRADLAHKSAQLEQALGEGTAQTGEMEALRTELLHAREEFERVRALQEESAAQAGKLLHAQAEMLRELEEARGRGEDLEMRIEEARREGEKASEALTEASAEKDRLLKQVASDAERRLRDQRAEADGDRAVLERQHHELTARVEALEAELKEVRGREEVERADLEEARRRLREDEQGREEAQRAGEEWETEKVRWRERESVLEEVVSVAVAYRDACAKLMGAVQASNVFGRFPNGDLGTTPPSRQPQPAQVQFPPIDATDAASALSALRSFPLAAFSDAVLKTGSTIRRWQKNTRDYRDRAKGRISYRNFAKGDLALFLPTRNNVAKPWAAFNVGFPHFFLDQSRGVDRALEGRDWLVARITAIRECVADSKDPASNPYSLVDGLKYHMLEVELVNLTAPDPSARRKTSLSASRSTEGNASMSTSMLASMSGSTVPRPNPEAESPPPVPVSPVIAQRPSPISRTFTQPFVPLLVREEPAPSPFSPTLSSDSPAAIGANSQHHEVTTIPESESEDSAPTPPPGIPFTAPHLPVPASTQHTLITEADMIHPTSPKMPSRSDTPARSNRGSFSSNRGKAFFGPSLSSSPSGKAAATTALMQTATPVEPGTPSPAESFGAAAIESARRLAPAGSLSSGQSAFAALANFGATFGRKRTASTVATSQSQGLGVSTPPTERREVSGAADLLKRFSRA
ncbi:hypothetical protein CALVIDRAFT_600136 [Calocera viscosa TUFC12733]|uniref:Autophagy-related protein 11 n=1 Tax=Calocera viscosa (strain TUFC12733) TaxID=1330018 RepID=A0A167K317_CALVF|nr:hypothetical protein CALVIDRAFT_600136 [Calocera viscosa TUFC12733]